MNSMPKPPPCPPIQRGQERLTPEQAAYARQFAQERVAAMLSTTPMNETVAEKHLQQAYRAAGLEPPRMRWFASPATFVRANIQEREDSVGNADVWTSVWTSMEESVRRSVRNSMGTSEWYKLGNGIKESVGDSVWHNLGDSVRNSVRNGLWMSVNASMWASVWAYFIESSLSLYHFFSEVFLPNDLIHLARFNEAYFQPS